MAIATSTVAIITGVRPMVAFVLVRDLLVFLVSAVYTAGRAVKPGSFVRVPVYVWEARLTVSPLPRGRLPRSSTPNAREAGNESTSAPTDRDVLRLVR